MEELLDKLTRHIKTLLEKQDELQKVQQTAQQTQNALMHEKKLLQEKNQIAISQIERMITRLKLLEKS
jgi:uncharacterized protein (TIGR02449 family)